MVRINLTVEELDVILSWGFSNGSIQADEDYDKKLLLKIKNALTKECAEDIWNEWITEPEPNKEEQEELEIRKKDITDVNGSFFCPKCNIPTNQKTYQTKCIICNTSLNRR